MCDEAARQGGAFAPRFGTKERRRGTSEPLPRSPSRRGAHSRHWSHASKPPGLVLRRRMGGQAKRNRDRPGSSAPRCSTTSKRRSRLRATYPIPSRSPIRPEDGEVSPITASPLLVCTGGDWTSRAKASLMGVRSPQSERSGPASRWALARWAREVPALVENVGAGKASERCAVWRDGLGSRSVGGTAR